MEFATCRTDNDIMLISRVTNQTNYTFVTHYFTHNILSLKNECERTNPLSQYICQNKLYFAVKTCYILIIRSLNLFFVITRALILKLS